MSNNGVSSGPTPFAKIMDTAIRAIIRGGKKKGALCFYMENWHYDFPEFLDWKQNNGDDYQRMRTANTAVFMTDEFMNRGIYRDGGFRQDAYVQESTCRRTVSSDFGEPADDITPMADMERHHQRACVEQQPWHDTYE